MRNFWLKEKRDKIRWIVVSNYPDKNLMEITLTGNRKYECRLDGDGSFTMAKIEGPDDDPEIQTRCLGICGKIALCKWLASGELELSRFLTVISYYNQFETNFHNLKEVADNLRNLSAKEM